MSPDKLRESKDNEYRERRPCTKERVNLAKIGDTKLPNCKDLFMLGVAKLKDELVIQQRMVDYLETVDHYLWNYCDSKGSCKDGNNLTEVGEAGLDEIKEGIKHKGWMIYSLDKSGKKVLDTKENFLVYGKPLYW